MVKFVKFLLILALPAIIGLFFAKWIFGPPPPSVIPTSTPREDKRVHCDAGFSIVVPESWSTNVSPYIICSQSSLPSSTSYPLGTIYAMEWLPDAGDPRTAQESEEVLFQKALAYLLLEHTPPRKAFGNQGYVYTLMFERSGKWYVLIYKSNQDVGGLPPVVMDYFETFRLDVGEKDAP